MKPKINPQIENILLFISYLEHLGNSGPEFRRAIELLPMFNKSENFWEKITEMKQMMGYAVILPEYKFSKLLSKLEYQMLSFKAIEDINERYLKISNNKLTTEDKTSILNGLVIFYSQVEFSLIPFYNQYRATKHDRIAYSGLSILFFMTLMVNLMDTLKGEIKNNEEKINAITQELKKVGLDTDDDDIQHKQDAITKIDNEISEEQLDLLMHHFRVEPENKQELFNSQMFSGFSLSNIFEDNLDLDNKSLESNYIRLIHEQVEKTFPKLSEHRQATLTGFIALHFDVLKEADYLRTSNNYTSFPTYLRDRVKGVLKTTRGKSNQKKQILP
jgi:hypothetical protein